MAGWLAGWLARWLADWLACWAIGQLTKEMWWFSWSWCGVCANADVLLFRGSFDYWLADGGAGAGAGGGGDGVAGGVAANLNRK